MSGVVGPRPESIFNNRFSFNFDGTLGTGEHVLVGNFQNAGDGTSCNLTGIYNKP